MSHGYKQSAAHAVALGLILQLSGCLNPRPEELPSASQLDPVVPGGVRETCESNPLLSGCELPASDINDAPNGGDLSENPQDPGPDAPGAAPSPEPEEVGAGDASTTDTPDAGRSTEALDAGSP